MTAEPARFLAGFARYVWYAGPGAACGRWTVKESERYGCFSAPRSIVQPLSTSEIASCARVSFIRYSSGQTLRQTLIQILVVLLHVLKSDILGQAVPQLNPLNLQAAMKFASLNRYEFEGSLVAALLQGTCTERIVSGEPEAREVVRAILASFLGPGGSLRAFRMDDASWSALTDGATLDWAYFVCAWSRKLWWFVCFADYY